MHVRPSRRILSKSSRVMGVTPGDDPAYNRSFARNFFSLDGLFSTAVVYFMGGKCLRRRAPRQEMGLGPCGSRRPVGGSVVIETEGDYRVVWISPRGANATGPRGHDAFRLCDSVGL